MNETILKVGDLAVLQEGHEVLKNISFDLTEGVFCGLVGANGAGKTTLLRAILRLLPSKGSLKTPSRMGYVPQKLNFEPDLPIRAHDFVGLGLDGYRFGFNFPSSKRTETINNALRSVEALEFANQRIGRLSGGQQQRVMIAHALVRMPDLLLLDEPLANLDIKASSEIINLLKRLCLERKMAVLISTHDITPLLPAMDKVLYLADGKAVCGHVEDVVRTEVLSALYGYHIDVIRVHGRILVVAGNQDHLHDSEHVMTIP